jgi:adenylate kinase family enzyme
LIQREDDTEKSVKKRLSFQWPQIKKLKEHIRNQGILEEVDGERSIEVIHEDILKRLKK